MKSLVGLWLFLFGLVSLFAAAGTSDFQSLSLFPVQSTSLLLLVLLGLGGIVLMFIGGKLIASDDRYQGYRKER